MRNEQNRRVVWVLETLVFDDEHQRLREAIASAGHDVVLWNDDWNQTRRWPDLSDAFVVLFHGSLENAAFVRESIPTWRPGAYCDVAAFHCSAYYPRTRQWLLNSDAIFTTVAALTQNPEAVLAPLGDKIGDRVFVRPDSPLKPFSGRVLERDQITLKSLDYGFYYENADLPIVAAPVRNVLREWRYVVVSGRIVAGSGYVAESRSANDVASDWQGEPLLFAQTVADLPSAPESVYVLDVGLVANDENDALRLLELNPFSGADLYDCERGAVVRAVLQHISNGNSS